MSALERMSAVQALRLELSWISSPGKTPNFLPHLLVNGSYRTTTMVMRARWSQVLGRPDLRLRKWYLRGRRVIFGAKGNHVRTPAYF